ncbi:MAG: UbiA prenyltransferase family protein [Deferribacteres bacterium]|nr:UbiA prenyltransferase family protein [candidate division KSB1 bacterium]MCB9501328.1 UbiA prenyltransferase family protein [Deferribacteres bacterium]
MLLEYFTLVRFHQWHKNFSVFLVLFLNQESITEDNIFTTFLAMFAFICASSFVYMVNDFFDQEYDRAHPVKRNRPLAAGSVSLHAAGIIASLALFLAFYLSLLVNLPAFYSILLYLVINLFYSSFGKRIPFLDVFLLAIGFMLRILCGAYAIEATISHWFVIIITQFCFLFGFSKRYIELISYTDPIKSRPVLAYYSKTALKRIVLGVGMSIILVYTLYTFSDRCIQTFQTTDLPYTIPFVFLGVWRFFYQVYYRKIGEDPASLLLQDKLLAGILTLWALSFTLIIHL